MREFLKLFEGWYTTLDTITWSGNKSLEIFSNPTKNDIRKFGNARALISNNGDLLYWDENVLHFEVEPSLDTRRPHLYLETKDELSLYWNELEFYRNEEFDEDSQCYEEYLLEDWVMVRSNPNIQRLLGSSAQIWGIDEHHAAYLMDEDFIERQVKK